MTSRKRPKKPNLPRAPLPRQRGGPHEAKNASKELKLALRIAERLNDKEG